MPLFSVHQFLFADGECIRASRHADRSFVMMADTISPTPHELCRLYSRCLYLRAEGHNLSLSKKMTHTLTMNNWELPSNTQTQSGE